ncbi:MAG TPA: hypothetical protein VHT29_15230 [Solirubrobacteraceae bacterium]|nr:hypothetical protein [Solirubrobacteraceae bacterium]
MDAKDNERPAVHVVLADNASGTAVIEDATDFNGDDEPMPDQMHHAAEAIRTYLKSVGAERVIVRVADFSPQARQTKGTKNRLRMEGAITSAATSVVPVTHLATGKDAGQWFGGSKADVEAAAAALVEVTSLHKRFGEAASAALAGIAL